MGKDRMESYSISVRLRRVTMEEGYVSVPVTDAIMQREIQADGTYRIDPDKLVAEAARLGAELTDWQVEEQQISMHPVQKAPEQLQQRLTDSP
jgi:hypothetical protein